MAFPAILLCALFLLPTLMVSAKKTYIVAMNHQDKPDSFLTHHEWHTATVESLSSAATSDSLIYSYKTAYNGFAAVLDEEQAESLRRSDSVLSIYEDPVYSLHTTRTPHFLGLDSYARIWEGHSSTELDHATENIIIGVLDTGIWPESKSFDDTGLPAIPKKWRGKCESGPDFDPKVCNKKLIGATSYHKGYDSAYDSASPKEIKSPRDHEGHGTHTASTAAGSKVANASLLGYANGTARGMAFRSRVASYKVCWRQGCYGSDILAAMEQAIFDGVDILSLSLGGEATNYYQDPISLGAFSAMEKGIFVSCSAGNSGPALETLANGAPWITTVGAGSLDRSFPAYIFLGNKVVYAGVSLYSGKGIGNKKVPLVYDNKTTTSSHLCLPGSLNKALVKGKVVVCDRGENARVEKGLVVKKAGGVGMILANTPTMGGEELLADSHLLPAVGVGAKVGDIIRKYAQSDPKPTALLTFRLTVLNVHPTPVVAAFSSRGPNWISPQILKPDIIGPGVNILAAWTGDLGPSAVVNDTRRTKFAILSGTSMSCPHLSGIAALVKAVHPNWSPSAIKSALMTTAYNQDNNNTPLHDAADGSIAIPWVSGAGHVDPKKALSPGLIYDTTRRQYINFICSLGYTQKQLQLIVKSPKYNCSRKVYSDPGQLNYPSFSPVFTTKRVVRYTRELTNVGPAPSSYSLTVNGHPSVDIIATPKKLNFVEVGQKLKFTLTFVAKNLTGPISHPYAFGSIVWASPQHQVRSPISFLWAPR